MADIPLAPDTPLPPSAQPVVHLDALPPGTRLAEFELRGLLGVGGFGLVYRAYDHSLHRLVAIKEYMPAALAARPSGQALSIRSSTDQATYQAGLQSFVAEARLLAQFDHPSLVKVYRFWEANNTAYMAMPLYSGMTLKQARAQMAVPPPEEWLRTVLWSILQALQVLHDHNTLHRDVSPDNIFLQDQGAPVLLDLGAARRTIADKSSKHTAILKVNYAPIEQYAQADDLKQGPWTDLYALAAVVYSCLCKEPPPPATARVVRDSMSPVQRVAATVQEHFGQAYTPAFVQAISHALALQPSERPQDVQEFVRDMHLQAPAGLGKFDWRAAVGRPLQAAAPDGGQATTQIPVQTSSPTQALPPPSRRRGWLAGVAVGVLVLGGLGLYKTLPSGDVPLVAAPEPAPVPLLAIPAAEPEAVAVDSTNPGPVAAQPGKPAGALAAPRPAARPAKPLPKQLCANTNFFSQQVCMFRECLKNENYNHPVCVESRRNQNNSPAE